MEYSLQYGSATSQIRRSRTTLTPRLSKTNTADVEMESNKTELMKKTMTRRNLFKTKTLRTKRKLLLEVLYLSKPRKRRGRRRRAAVRERTRMRKIE